MYATFSAWKRCSVRLYLQLFVGRLMLYLCHICFFPHSGVQYVLTTSILVTYRASYKWQKLSTFGEHLCSPTTETVYLWRAPVFTHDRNCLPLASTCVHPRILVGSVLLIFLVFCVVFLCSVWLCLVSCVRNVANVSGLSTLDCPFGFL